MPPSKDKKSLSKRQEYNNNNSNNKNNNEQKKKRERPPKKPKQNLRPSITTDDVRRTAPTPTDLSPDSSVLGGDPLETRWNLVINPIKPGDTQRNPSETQWWKEKRQNSVKLGKNCMKPMTTLSKWPVSMKLSSTK